jgi:hypothetical protein
LFFALFVLGLVCDLFVFHALLFKLHSAIFRHPIAINIIARAFLLFALVKTRRRVRRGEGGKVTKGEKHISRKQLGGKLHGLDGISEEDEKARLAIKWFEIFHRTSSAQAGSRFH